MGLSLPPSFPHVGLAPLLVLSILGSMHQLLGFSHEPPASVGSENVAPSYPAEGWPTNAPLLSKASRGPSQAFPCDLHPGLTEERECRRGSSVKSLHPRQPDSALLRALPALHPQPDLPFPLMNLACLRKGVSPQLPWF